MDTDQFKEVTAPSGRRVKILKATSLKMRKIPMKQIRQNFSCISVTTFTQFSRKDKLM